MHEAMGSCMLFEEVHEVMHEHKIIIALLKSCHVDACITCTCMVHRSSGACSCMAFMGMYMHALAQGLKLCGARGSSGSIPEGGLVMGSALARPVDRTWHLKCVYAVDGGWQDGASAWRL